MKSNGGNFGDNDQSSRYPQMQSSQGSDRQKPASRQSNEYPGGNQANFSSSDYPQFSNNSNQSNQSQYPLGHQTGNNDKMKAFLNDSQSSKQSYGQVPNAQPSQKVSPNEQFFPNTGLQAPPASSTSSYSSDSTRFPSTQQHQYSNPPNNFQSKYSQQQPDFFAAINNSFSKKNSNPNPNPSGGNFFFQPSDTSQQSSGYPGSQPSRNQATPSSDSSEMEGRFPSISHVNQSSLGDSNASYKYPDIVHQAVPSSYQEQQSFKSNEAPKKKFSIFSKNKDKKTKQSQNCNQNLDLFAIQPSINQGSGQDVGGASQKPEYNTGPPAKQESPERREDPVFADNLESKQDELMTKRSSFIDDTRSEEEDPFAELTEDQKVEHQQRKDEKASKEKIIDSPQDSFNVANLKLDPPPSVPKQENYPQGGQGQQDYYPQTGQGTYPGQKGQNMDSFMNNQDSFGQDQHQSYDQNQSYGYNQTQREQGNQGGGKMQSIDSFLNNQDSFGPNQHQQYDKNYQESYGQKQPQVGQGNKSGEKLQSIDSFLNNTDSFGPNQHQSFQDNQDPTKKSSPQAGGQKQPKSFKQDLQQSFSAYKQKSNASNLDYDQYANLYTQRSSLQGRLTSMNPRDEGGLHGNLASQLNDIDELLGLDGGSNYSSFADPNRQNYNNQPSFDYGENHQNKQIGGLESFAYGKASRNERDNDSSREGSLDLDALSNQLNNQFSSGLKNSSQEKPNTEDNTPNTQSSAEFSRKKFQQQQQQSTRSEEEDYYPQDLQSIYKYNDNTQGQAPGSTGMQSNNKPKTSPLAFSNSRLMGYEDNVNPMSSLSMLKGEQSMRVDEQLEKENQNRLKNLGNLQSIQDSYNKKQGTGYQHKQNQQQYPNMGAIQEQPEKYTGRKY